jgi:hypothetical protein
MVARAHQRSSCNRNTKFFNFQFDKAKAIHLEYKDAKLPDERTFSRAVLEDFKELQDAGVTHSDMERSNRCSPAKRTRDEYGDELGNRTRSRELNAPHHLALMRRVGRPASVSHHALAW